MNDTPDPAVVARRIAERREQLGLGEEALAHRASMAPRYLRCLLEAGPSFDPGGFVRIAAALDSTPEELVSGRADAPPGQGGPGPRPRLLDLTEQECWQLVGDHGIGRIALPVEPGPVVLPVNYVVDRGSFAYRTGEHGAASRRRGPRSPSRSTTSTSTSGAAGACSPSAPRTTWTTPPNWNVWPACPARPPGRVGTGRAGCGSARRRSADGSWSRGDAPAVPPGPGAPAGGRATGTGTARGRVSR